MKYIDAECLMELLEGKYKEFTETAKKNCPLQYQYMADGLDIAEQFIYSLQQEQPNDVSAEIKDYYGEDLAFDEEVKKILDRYFYFSAEDQEISTPDIIKLTARHFYELGLKAK